MDISKLDDDLQDAYLFQLTSNTLTGLRFLTDDLRRNPSLLSKDWRPFFSDWVGDEIADTRRLLQEARA